MVSAILPRKQPEFIDNRQDASPKQSCTYRKSKQDPAHRQKRNQLQAEMREFRQLKTEWLNPIKKDDESMRATFLLFQAAIKLSEDKHDQFFVIHWEPFLNAWEAQIKEKEKSTWGHVVREDNRVKAQIGKGKYNALSSL